MSFCRTLVVVCLVVLVCPFLHAEETAPLETPEIGPVYHHRMTFSACSGSALEWACDGINANFRDENDPISFKLPDRVDSEMPVKGGTIAVGDDLYGVLIMYLKEENVQQNDWNSLFPQKKSHFPSAWNFGEMEIQEPAQIDITKDTTFKKQLFENDVFADLFPDKEIYIDTASHSAHSDFLPGESHGTPIMITSENLLKKMQSVIIKDNPDIVINESLFEKQMNFLGSLFRQIDYLESRYYVGMLNEYPERKLYKTLPPESENEGAFLKMIRKDRGKKTEVKDDGIESRIYGLKWDEQGEIEIIQEEFAEPETPKGKAFQRWNTVMPFRLGGFCSEDSSCRFMYRLDLPGMTMTDGKLNMHAGTSIIPKEKRKESGEIFLFCAGFSFCSDYSSDENPADLKVVFEEGPVIFNTVIQKDNVPEEEGVLTTETLDRINEEFVTSFQPLISDIVSALTEQGEKGILDFAFDQEEDIAFVGCAFSKAGEVFNPVAFATIADAFQEKLEQTRNPYRETGNNFENLSFQTTSNTEQWNGFQISEMIVTYSQGKDKIRIILATSEEMIGAAVEEIKTEESDDGTDPEAESFAEITSRLKEKIEKSQALERDNCPIPNTIAVWGDDDTWVVLSNETSGHRSKYTLKMTHQAIPQVMAIAKALFPSLAP